MGLHACILYSIGVCVYVGGGHINIFSGGPQSSSYGPDSCKEKCISKLYSKYLLFVELEQSSLNGLDFCREISFHL